MKINTTFEDLIDSLSDQMSYLRQRILDTKELGSNEIKFFENSMEKIFDFFCLKWRELGHLGFEENSIIVEETKEIPQKLLTLFSKLEEIGVIKQNVSQKIGELALEGEKHNYSPIWCVRFSCEIGKIIEYLSTFSEGVENVNNNEASKISRAYNRDGYVCGQDSYRDIRQAAFKSRELRESSLHGSELRVLEREGLDEYNSRRLTDDGTFSQLSRGDTEAAAHKEFHLQKREERNRGESGEGTSGVLEDFFRKHRELADRTERRSFYRGVHPDSDYVRKIRDRLNPLNPKDRNLLEKGLSAFYLQEDSRELNNLLSYMLIQDGIAYKRIKNIKVTSLNKEVDSILSEEQKKLDARQILKKYIDAICLDDITKIGNKEFLDALFDANIKKVPQKESQKESYRFEENPNENKKIREKFRK